MIASCAAINSTLKRLATWMPRTLSSEVETMKPLIHTHCGTSGKAMLR